jgi:hypothetical protein
MTNQKKCLWILLSLVALAGCGVLSTAGPTKVARGQRYASGVASYDRFFEQLHELQTRMHAAVKDEERVRKELSEALGLEPDASRSLIERRVQKGTEQLTENRVGIKLELIGLDREDQEGDARVTTEGTTNERDAKFVEAIESGAKASARLVVQMRDVKKRARRLSALLPTLETSVDAEFRLLGPARKSEVRRNLYDAKLLLPLIADLSDEVSGETMKLVAALEHVSSTPLSDEEENRVGDYQKLTQDPNATGDRRASPAPAKPPTTAKPTNPAPPPSASKRPESRVVQAADFQP